MQLVAVGLNHRSAPVALRESLDFRRDGLDTALRALGHCQLVREAVLLSTCNRSEIYAAVETDAVADACARFMADYHAVRWEHLAPHVFVKHGAEAARHLFRVAAGLESLVVGEPQILGQVKEAFAASEQAKRSGALTSRAFAAAFTVGKRVRSETALGEGAVSVSYAAIALARKIFGRLAGRDVLVLGAGEMAELTGVHLRAQQVGRITIANRTLTTAQGLAAKLDGVAVAWPALADAVKTADIIVSATGAAETVLTRGMVEDAMRARRGRPLFIIDIAVPRDVEADAGRLEQVFLYNIDDLQSIVHENLGRRDAELARADAIVVEELAKFAAWLQSRRIVPTVVALRERFEAIRQSELRRLAPRVASLTPDARERIDEVTHLIVEKLLLTPTEQLKGLSDETTMASCAEAVSKLFALSQDPASGRERPVRVASRTGGRS
jgi:glutamyl-tRNA reductase